MNFNIKYSKSLGLDDYEYHIFDITPTLESNIFSFNISIRLYDLKLLGQFIKEYNSCTSTRSILKCEPLTIQNNILYLHTTSSSTIMDANIKGRDNINKFLKELTDNVK